MDEVGCRSQLAIWFQLALVWSTKPSLMNAGEECFCPQNELRLGKPESEEAPFRLVSLNLPDDLAHHTRRIAQVRAAESLGLRFCNGAFTGTLPGRQGDRRAVASRRRWSATARVCQTGSSPCRTVARTVASANVARGEYRCRASRRVERAVARRACTRRVGPAVRPVHDRASA